MSTSIPLPAPSPIPNEVRAALLKLAREALLAKLAGQPAPLAAGLHASVPACGGVFVSIYRHQRLRGCIGRIRELPSPAQVICECAIAAAMDDPRFAPMTLAEADGLRVEISVLSVPRVARPEDVQPGTHGLAIERGYNRGVLLPQVAARYNWSRERFLEETCQKAGLPPDAWRDPQTQIAIFTAEVFAEES